jgi:hypothetical protein
MRSCVLLAISYLPRWLTCASSLSHFSLTVVASFVDGGCIDTLLELPFSNRRVSLRRGLLLPWSSVILLLMDGRRQYLILVPHNDAGWPNSNLETLQQRQALVRGPHPLPPPKWQAGGGDPSIPGRRRRGRGRWRRRLGWNPSNRLCFFPGRKTFLEVKYVNMCCFLYEKICKILERNSNRFKLPTCCTSLNIYIIIIIQIIKDDLHHLTLAVHSTASLWWSTSHNLMTDRCLTWNCLELSLLVRLISQWCTMYVCVESRVVWLF